jgi:very-short-patch-repair endonuclease
VLDFYCAEVRLAVEIDGVSHDLGDRPERDLRRDAWPAGMGVTVLRIAAGEVMRDVDGVADAINTQAKAMMESRAPSTALARGPPPPLRG